MTLTIDLTAEDEARLVCAAKQKGVAPAECARELLATHLPRLTPTSPLEDPTFAVLDQWAQEDAAKTPAEATEEERIWREFEQGVNQSRVALGMRQL